MNTPRDGVPPNAASFPPATDPAGADSNISPVFQALRVEYLEHCRSRLGQIQEALQQGDLAAVQRAGHDWKGTGAAYGFAEITDLGRALELAARDGLAATARAVVERIGAYLRIVRPPGEE